MVNFHIHKYVREAVHREDLWQSLFFSRKGKEKGIGILFSQEIGVK
jgi:hypothetical protein